MKKNVFVALASLAMLLSSCGLKREVARMGAMRSPYYGTVYVYELGDDDTIPSGEKLGKVFIRGKAFTRTKKCNYDRVMEAAKQKAREIGGNVIVVQNTRKGNFWNTCYRIEGLVYWIDGKEK